MPRNYKVIKRLPLVYSNPLIITKITVSSNQSTTKSVLGKELQFRVFNFQFWNYYVMYISYSFGKM